MARSVDQWIVGMPAAEGQYRRGRSGEYIWPALAPHEQKSPHPRDAGFFGCLLTSSRDGFFWTCRCCTRDAKAKRLPACAATAAGRSTTAESSVPIHSFPLGALALGQSALEEANDGFAAVTRLVAGNGVLADRHDCFFGHESSPCLMAPRRMTAPGSRGLRWAGENLPTRDLGHT